MMEIDDGEEERRKLTPAQTHSTDSHSLDTQNGEIMKGQGKGRGSGKSVDEG